MFIDIPAVEPAPPSVQPRMENKPPAITGAVAMPQPKLIGLTGKARSGKDTVAKMLQDGRAVKLISFAEPIRDALRGMIGLTDEHFHGSLKEVPLGWIDKSPRQLMQTLGTQWGRELVDDQLWIKLAQKNILNYLSLGVNVVVTDVRFENEAKLIRDMGGFVWHVKRDGVQAVAAHASEAGVEFFNGLDFALHNNSTLDELRLQAEYLWYFSERNSHE